MFEGYVKLPPRFRRAYDLLLERFGTSSFRYEDTEEVLKDYANRKEVLSKLEDVGLLQVEVDSQDRRRRIYRLIPLNTGSVSKDELIKLLKNAADLIRTRVDYRVLLIFLFFKAISDKYTEREKYYLSNGYSREDARALANYDILTLYDPEKGKLYTWQELKSPEELINGLYRVVDMNREKLKNLNLLIDRTGLPTLFNSENAHLVNKLINLFGRFDFSKVPYDALGDAYEWILYYFAPTKAKEGEIYTPIEVSRLLAHLVDPGDEEIILDPACGSGSMLVEQYLYIKNVKGVKNPSVELIGQEANEITAVLAELNAILHGIKDISIEVGDSLINPKFVEADRVVINPPWSQDGYDESTLKLNKDFRKIYKFGFTPKSYADWAWIQLVAHFTKKRAGIVIDQGALFRGGKEKNIRRQVLEAKVIDAVILLPEKIFYNTQAPGVIIVLNKEKPKDREDKVIFINASNEFIQHPEVKKLNKLSDENIRRIANAYREFKDIEGFSKVVSLDEIKKNDYNLNVSLYVAPVVEEEDINLEEEFKKLERLHRDYVKRYEVVKGYLEELKRLGA